MLEVTKSYFPSFRFTKAILGPAADSENLSGKMHQKKVHSAQLDHFLGCRNLQSLFGNVQHGVDSETKVIGFTLCSFFFFPSLFSLCVSSGITFTAVSSSSLVFAVFCIVCFAVNPTQCHFHSCSCRILL